MDSREQISQVVVNAQQMRDIEGRVFAAFWNAVTFDGGGRADCPKSVQASLFT